MLTNIYSLEKLKEGESIPSLTIPSLIREEDKVITIEIIGPSVFIKNMNIDDDYLICNLSHPIGELKIESGIRYITYEAFMDSNVKTVVWPDTCQSMSTRCFKGSTVNEINNLTGITLISAEVFAGCENLDNVNFGNIVVCDENAFKFSKIKRKSYNEKPCKRQMIMAI